MSSSSSVPSSSSKVVLITGANQGIGFEAVKLLAAQQPTWRILLGARSEAKGAEAIKQLGSPANVSLLLIDVTSADSIRAAVERVRKDFGGRVDVLIQNAGIAFLDGPNTERSVLHEHAVSTFATNVFGVRAVHDAFLPLLPPQTGKEIIVSSEVGSWAHHGAPAETRKQIEAIDTLSWSQLSALADTFLEQVRTGSEAKQFGDPALSFGSYGTSKMFVSAYGRTLARDLKSQGIPVLLSTPGYCATNLNNFGGPRSAEVGAKSVLLNLERGMADSGKLWLDGAEVPVAEPNPFVAAK